MPIDIDSITIHFTDNDRGLMNFCLGIIMFGVALNIRLADFHRITQYPKSVITGLASQWLILPILTVYLIHIWQPHPSVALGLLLVSACPGGNMSNFLTHLSKGNTALSVTMTSVVTICSIILTPLLFIAFALFVPQVKSLLEKVTLDPEQIFSILFFVLIGPLISGMLVHHYLPTLTRIIRKPITVVSLIIYAGFIFFALHANLDNITSYVHLVLSLVVVHNLLAMGAGYFWARWNRLSEKDARAICMETGIQNAGLGMLLVIHFFPHLGGMLLVTAVWAIWDLISGIAIAFYWNKRPGGK